MATTNAGSKATETFGTTSPTTGSAPTDATDGQPIGDFTAVSVFVSVGSGVTLSGAGSLLCYLYDAGVGRWARAPAYDLAVSTATVRDLFLDTFDVTCPRNSRVKWVPSGVTFSAGSAGATVTQLGFVKGVQYA